MANATLSLGMVEDQLEMYLVKKAPALPEAWKEIIVKLSPWFATIGLIFMIPLVLVFFGVSFITAPLSMMGGYTGNYVVDAVFIVAITALTALSIPGLFKRTKQGWQYAFLSVLVSGIHNVLMFNLSGLIIGTLLSLYILFQVRSHYK